MGRILLTYAEEDLVYVCKNCNTHLTTPNEIVSKVSLSLLVCSYSQLFKEDMGKILHVILNEQMATPMSIKRSI